jgi:hypothetical protein
MRPPATVPAGAVAQGAHLPVSRRERRSGAIRAAARVLQPSAGYANHKSPERRS